MIKAIGIRDKTNFRIVNTADFNRELLKLKPGRYQITIERYRRKKSHSQLGYLYGVVYPLSQKFLLDAGWELATIDAVDAFWKSRFAEQEIVNRHTGEVMMIPGLKRDFTTTDMMGYIEAIRNYCSEYLGGYIPEPEQQTEIDYEKRSEL